MIKGKMRYRPRDLPDAATWLPQRIKDYFLDATVQQIFDFFTEEGEECVYIDRAVSHVKELCRELGWSAPTQNDEQDVKDLFSICDEDGSDKIEKDDLAVIFDKIESTGNTEAEVDDMLEEVKQFKLAEDAADVFEEAEDEVLE